MGLAISLWRAGNVRVFFRCGACFFAVAGGCFACWAVVSFLSGCFLCRCNSLQVPR
jgi:hypothetical protein